MARQARQDNAMQSKYNTKKMAMARYARQGKARQSKYNTKQHKTGGQVRAR